MIRARPADLPDLCCALARELLTLENRFALEVINKWACTSESYSSAPPRDRRPCSIRTQTQEFPSLRRRALVALIATAPERVAPLLAALAFDAQLSFGMRLEVRASGVGWHRCCCSMFQHLPSQHAYTGTHT